ncbi:hypothetical protein [Vibrio phage phiKT1024]|nr:hypothetical protein [Vibrio phage phiKT1024]
MQTKNKETIQRNKIEKEYADYTISTVFIDGELNHYQVEIETYVPYFKTNIETFKAGEFAKIDSFISKTEKTLFILNMINDHSHWSGPYGHEVSCEQFHSIAESISDEMTRI